MSVDDDVLLSIAQSVTDGKPVDWRAEAQTHPRLRSRIEHLQLVQSIGAVYRSESADVVETSGPGVGAGVASPGNAPPTRWGPLEIRSQLGAGGFGQVFRAHDPTLQRDVALKLLFARPAGEHLNEQRYLNEARTLARVKHSNVLVVHGADKHDGRIGIWMDLLEGATLEQCLTRQGPFGPEEATLVGIDLCRALAAVHGAGLVHRDVKTANVMRERGGRIVLLDFSSATEQDPRTGSLASDASGTPYYMAPEVFRGGKASFQSDIYSLGVVLFRLATGRYPVEASNLTDLGAKLGSGESLALRDVRPDLPAAFVEIVERALDHDVEKRYASVGKMERALTSSRGSVPQTEDIVVAGPARAKAWWRRPASAAAAVVILAAAALTWWLVPRGSLDIEVELFRSRVIERAGQVTLSEERLPPGSQVRLGDSLFLEIEGSRPLYAYVLNEDDAGQAFLLFPLPDLTPGNPLPPGVRHRLPGQAEGEPVYWDVTSAGGRDTILVIASRRPLTDLERELEQMPRAGDRAVELTPEARIGILRGIGGLSQGPAPGPTSEPNRASRLADLAQRSANTSGLKIWRMQLNTVSE